MKARVISPLHIGNGSVLTPLDYYPGNTIHVLDTIRLIKDITAKGIALEEVLEDIKNPGGDRYVWKEYIEKLGLDVKEYTLYTLKVYGGIGKESMQIREFIKQNGLPYVPGSSIKGAIRTALLYKVLKEYNDSVAVGGVVSRVNGEFGREIMNYSDTLGFYISYLEKKIKESRERRKGRRGRRFDPKRADDILEAIVFGMERTGREVRYEPKRDPLRALVVRDSESLGRGHLAVYRVEVVGGQSSIPVWVEALEPGAEFSFEVYADEKTLKTGGEYFNGLLWEYLRDGGYLDSFMDFVWNAVSEFYRDVAKVELEEKRKFGKHAGKVEAFYKSLLEGDSTFLRVGWGSGWIATTVGILLRGNPKWKFLRKELGLGKNPRTKKFSEDFPKTRRLAEGLPMGWVVLE